MTSKDFENTGGRAPMASEVEPGELAQLAVEQLQVSSQHCRAHVDVRLLRPNPASQRPRLILIEVS